MADRRVLMVALDGLEITLLKHAFDAGRLPNLRAFAEATSEFAVHSDGELLEGSVWPTFASGTGPGTHGQHWFYQWVAAESRFVATSDDRFGFEPFWKAALDAGKRVVAIDIPYMAPVRHSNERAYNGWGLQDEMAEQFHPPAFRKDILRRHGRSKVHKDTLLVRTPEDRLKLARKLRAGARQRSGLLLDLVGRRDWDLVIFGFGEFHLGGHHLAIPMELSPKVTSESAMYSIVKPLDDMWPAIVAAAGEDCDIFLFAVHGMQPKRSYPEAITRIINQMEGRPAPVLEENDLLRKARNLLPQEVHQAVWLRMPAQFRMERMIKAWMTRIDIHQGRLFVFEGDCAVAIRVNMAGRERFGTVAPDEAPAALQALFAEAARYRTEEDTPAFTKLIATHDVYAGPRVDDLPDAMIQYNPEVVRTRKLTRDDGTTLELVGAESRTGIHTSRGFLFHRPGSPVTIHRDEFDNMDFAPTVLQRLGVTPPAALEGSAFLE